MILGKAHSISMGHLDVQDARPCKSKAQSGALLRVRSAVVPFSVGVRLVEKVND